MTTPPYVEWIFIVIPLGVIVLMIASMWTIFSKAGKPGWAAIVPIYNLIVLLEIVGKPWWWILLMFIPIVNIVIFIIVYHSLSLSFGKDVGFTVGLILLGIVFLPILAFGDSTYIDEDGEHEEFNLNEKVKYEGYYRSSDEKILLGVCGGLSHKFNIPLILVRMGVIILGFFTIIIGLWEYLYIDTRIPITMNLGFFTIIIGLLYLGGKLVPEFPTKGI